MPTIQDRLEERDPSDLRVLTRHSLGFIALGGETCVLVEMTGRNPVTGSDERTSFVVSLAGAVTLCTDLTGVVESDQGILALVKSTLAGAQAMKMRADAAARCGRGPDECEDCADAAAEAAGPGLRAIADAIATFEPEER